MGKNIQVSYEFFCNLDLFLSTLNSENLNNRQKALLSSLLFDISYKREKMYLRKLYSNYKSERDPVMKEYLRQEYLDTAGVPEDYRY